MRRCFLAAALLLASPPVFAQDASYEQSVAARQANEPARAVELLEPLVEREPSNTDARVQLGYALLALGADDRAAEQFRAVLAIAPGYTDASKGLALAQRRKEATGFILLEGAVADLDGGFRDWHEAGVTASLPLSRHVTVVPSATWFRRFGRDDFEIASTHVFRAGDDTWLHLGGSAAPEAVFRPELGVFAGVDHRFDSGPDALIAGIEGKWQRFVLQDVVTVTPSVTQYFAGGTMSATGRMNVVKAEGDDIRAGGLARYDWMPGVRSRVFFGGAFGPDTELGVVTQTSSLFAGGEQPLGTSLSLTGSLTREWRDGPADRTEARLGVKVGF